METTGRATPAVHHVVHRITGTAPAAFVTYAGDGATPQESDVDVPWNRKLDLPAGFFAQVSAQNAGDATITCAIVVNGRTVGTATSTGEYAIASCNADVS